MARMWVLWAKISSGIGDAVITRVYLPPSGHVADTTKTRPRLSLFAWQRRDGVWVRLSGVGRLSDGSTHHSRNKTIQKHLGFSISHFGSRFSVGVSNSANMHIAQHRITPFWSSVGMNEDFLVSSPWRVLIDSIVYTGTSVLVWCLFFLLTSFVLFLFSSWFQ